MVLLGVLLPPVLALAAEAATSDVRAEADTGALAPARPRIGLVLSGGGARGFAHIGVLQVLEELRVPVDVIAATSMGSIIGGAYAAGYTPEQLQRLARTNDWDAIFSVRAPRADLPFRRKEDDEKNLSSIEFGIKSTGLTLPRGAVGAQNLGLFLRALGGPVQEINDLATLPIPFAAAATDLGSGKLVVLQADVPLATAMRASISVPGAIAPIEWQGRPLVDGGLVRNLPVDVARKMGADVIIAVNVGRPLAPANTLSNLLAVTDQMVSLLIEQNVEKSLAELCPGDVLITPQLDGLGSSDFLQGKAMIAAGAAAARALAPRLAALALKPQDYERYEQKRSARMLDERAVRLAAIRVEGLKTVNPEAVTRTLDLPLQQALRAAEITVAVQRAYATGDFEAVNYRLVPAQEEDSRPDVAAPGLGPVAADSAALEETTPRDAPQVLIVTPYEKPWGYNTLRFGGNVLTDFKGNNVFNILFAHTWGWRNSYGAEWRNEVQFGDTQRLFSEWYQPLAPASRWFVAPQVQGKRESFDLYVERQPVARFQNTSTEANLQLGYALGQLGSVRASVGHSVIETATLIGPPLLPVTRVDTTGFGFNARLDTLDSLSFPRHGFLFNASYTRYSSLAGSAEAKDAWTVDVTRAFSLERVVLALSGRAGMAAQEGTFRLGGFLNLSGTPVGEVSGARVAFGRALLTRNVSDALGDLAMPVYAGVSLEAGAAGPRRDPFHGFGHAATLLLGADSPIGPIYLGLGHTFGRASALYLYWGRPL